MARHGPELTSAQVRSVEFAAEARSVVSLRTSLCSMICSEERDKGEGRSNASDIYMY